MTQCLDQSIHSLSHFFFNKNTIKGKKKSAYVFFFKAEDEYITMNYEDLLISYGSFNQSCGIEIFLHTDWVGGLFPIEWQSLSLSLF